MRRDHRPLLLHKINKTWTELYAKHYLNPQFDTVGIGSRYINPYYIEINGPHIHLGDHVHMMAKKENPICLTSYTGPHGSGRIEIGNYCILLPGTNIISSLSISTGNNCMFAANSYISDADWHGIYDRTSVPGKTAPIRLGDNVWIGYGATLGKGVTVGDNSIIGAKAVVTKDIPSNVIVAGNPASVVKKLDPNYSFIKRESLFFGEDPFWEYSDRLERFCYSPNTFRNWIRTLIRPTRKD